MLTVYYKSCRKTRGILTAETVEDVTGALRAWASCAGPMLFIKKLRKKEESYQTGGREGGPLSKGLRVRASPRTLFCRLAPLSDAGGAIPDLGCGDAPCRVVMESLSSRASTRAVTQPLGPRVSLVIIRGYQPVTEDTAQGTSHQASQGNQGDSYYK